MVIFSGRTTAGAALTLSVLTTWARDDAASRWYIVVSFVKFWALGLLTWAVWGMLVYPLMLSPLRGLPEPSGNHWLMGQGLRVLKQPTGWAMLTWMHNLDHDGIIRFRGLFNQDQFLICSPAAAGEVLVTRVDAFEKPGLLRSIAGRILGNGILFAEGDDHRMQRRKLMPAFAFRRIKELYPHFWEKACESVQAVTAEIGGREEMELELHGWMSRITLDIIGALGLGRDFGAVADEDNPLHQTFTSVLAPNKAAAFFVLLRVIFPAWLVNMIPTRRNASINEASQHLRNVCRELVRDKTSRLAKGEEPDPDILSAALQGAGFEEEQTVDQAMTFLAAGHETVAASMAWAMYALCRHPDVQRKLRQEVRDKLPGVDSDKSVTGSDVEGLPYLSAVCNEVFRMYPPIPLTVRQPINDTTIQGIPIPKGTRIVLCPWATNKCRLYWGPTAEQFIPERWLEGEAEASSQHDATNPDSEETTERKAPGGATSPYANLTFMHGPRSCIGQGFARAEFACLLAAFVGRFEVELRDGAEGPKAELVGEQGLGISKGAFTSKPGKGGLHLRLRPLGGF